MTVIHGLKIQNQQLAQWKKVLKAAVYRRLYCEAKTHNSKMEAGATGYDVWRGSDLDQFIANVKNE